MWTVIKKPFVNRRRACEPYISLWVERQHNLPVRDSIVLLFRAGENLRYFAITRRHSDAVRKHLNEADVSCRPVHYGSGKNPPPNINRQLRAWGITRFFLRVDNNGQTFPLWDYYKNAKIPSGGINEARRGALGSWCGPSKEILKLLVHYFKNARTGTSGPECNEDGQIALDGTRTGSSWCHTKLHAKMLEWECGSWGARDVVKLIVSSGLASQHFCGPRSATSCYLGGLWGERFETRSRQRHIPKGPPSTPVHWYVTGVPQSPALKGNHGHRKVQF